MKLCTPILLSFVTTLTTGCNPSEPAMTLSHEPLAQRSSADDDRSSVKAGFTNSPGDSTLDNEVVQADVLTIQNAVYQGDVEVVLGYTHPKIIEMMGGRTHAKAGLQTALSKAQAQEVTLESFDFPDDPTFLRTDENHFVIVPTKSIITVNNQRIESLNYQFGIKTVGSSKWTYIEGSRINIQNVRILFPDFPSYYEFPEFYRRKP